MVYLRLIYESFQFAWQALRSNLLRTVLSLLGVTIGIFAIIAVLTIVDSLEKNIRSSMNFLGDKVIYVQKWPWSFGGEYEWWRYFKRPKPSLREFKILERQLENHNGVAIFWSRGGNTLKYRSNSISNINLQGASFQFNRVSDVPIEDGRYFTQQEVNSARNVMIIGSEVAKDLFPYQDPIGKEIRLRGLKFNVIGIMEKQGENLLGMPSNDKNAIIPYGAFNKMFATNQFGSEPLIAVKGLDDDEGLLELEYEITGLMRNIRGLKPREEVDFALNRPEMLAEMVTGMFSAIRVAGWVIGGFAMLVGGFGIANIMFVSVKERTNIIGIQKSLGAKNYFILFQFLFESVFLSLFGGMLGILLVMLLTLIPQDAMEITLSAGNIIVGMAVSVVVGMLSGIIPAVMAANLDPVIAIRSK